MNERNTDTLRDTCRLNLGKSLLEMDRSSLIPYTYNGSEAKREIVGIVHSE